jgi:hypothetical protein
MEATNRILVQNRKESILIHWQELTFYWTISVLWRGIYFVIHIKVLKTELFSTRIITFKYKGDEYPCSLTKWKYMGGGNGVYPPHIETELHSLKIRLTFNSIELTDFRKVDSENHEIHSNPFIVFYQS